MAVKNEDLKCFLYVLMREYVPCGVVARIMRKVSKAHGKKIRYSNKGLAEYAGDITRKLIEE